MKRTLLAAATALAALAVYAAPAGAADGGFLARTGPLVGVPEGNGVHGGMRGCFGHRDCRNFRNGQAQSEVISDWYGGEWALYNNRSWDSDSYNDWWHDRPDRAYPAWLRHNRDCQRMWFAGDTLRC
jgi:hypothetical protein